MYITNGPWQRLRDPVSNEKQLFQYFRKAQTPTFIHLSLLETDSLTRCYCICFCCVIITTTENASIVAIIMNANIICN